jgi:hypothetical protein
MVIGEIVAREDTVCAGRGLAAETLLDRLREFPTFLTAFFTADAERPVEGWPMLIAELRSKSFVRMPRNARSSVISRPMRLNANYLAGSPTI